ncbi:uncharacterized protein LOC125887247 [Epinephelus fuscoguttatus]|uniref:uncharacterized protein LOC125887247 n=1 Tax=Epinephelus fuscoguttatus TaxID=293821 RepID=UPI0020D0A8FA|nr:uncharacterized protein LOC125887247 [Epinephelus fuscoguttatus]
MSVKLEGNILVTGTNRGIGLELVRQLAETTGEQAHIYACCRAPEGPRAERFWYLTARLVTTPPPVLVYPPACSSSVPLPSWTAHLATTPLPASDHSCSLPVGTSTRAAGSSDHEASSSSSSAEVSYFSSPRLSPRDYMSDEDSISAAVQAVSKQIGAGGLNLLINNAAITKLAIPGPLSATGKKDMMEVYETNVVGPFLIAKAALNMLTRCQAEDFKSYNILVTAIHPGWVRTEMGGEEVR